MICADTMHIYFFHFISTFAYVSPVRRFALCAFILFFCFTVLPCFFPPPPSQHLNQNVATLLREGGKRIQEVPLVLDTLLFFSSMVLSKVGQRPVGDLSISGGVCVESLCQRPVNIDPSRAPFKTNIRGIPLLYLPPPHPLQ